MSSLHLNHMVPWKDLIDHCTVYVDHGIELPTGKSCGRIHLVDKETRLKVGNRKYLADKICTADDCETAVGKKSIFRKSEKKIVSISGEFNLIPWRVAKASSIDRFINSLSDAIEEFARTERRKFLGERTPDRSIDSNHVIETLKENGKWPEKEGFWWSCDCPLFAVLMEMGDTQTLLSFSDEQISKVFGCLHGGQAVGNNFAFLRRYVLLVYLYTNLIAALDLHEEPDKWGPMKPRGLRQGLMHDCDGQTFLFGGRRLLKDDVYMKDWEGMKELTKTCFRFFYMLDMVRKEVGLDSNPRDYLFGCYDGE